MSVCLILTLTVVLMTCSLEDLVAGVWEVQEHIDGLADMEDNPKGLQQGLAGLSAVTEQRTKLQVLSRCTSGTAKCGLYGCNCQSRGEISHTRLP